jgi:hypothetical protein
MQIKIPVHSFIDLITNSSSELFVTSDRKTVDSFRKLIDSILLSGGSTKKCDDLFTLKLESCDGDYGEYNSLLAVAKDNSSKEAADLITSVNTMFQAENIGNDY